MNELRPTFKDNCLIGVFSYAAHSWEPKKGSDNSLIMQPQRMPAFAGCAVRKELTAFCSPRVHFIR